MGLKYVCDICGRECDIATDAHPEPIEHYSVSVARSPEGWAIIWSRAASKSKEPGKLEAIPLAGERIACCFSCAERALAQIHREQLEFIFSYIPVRPETKLMSAIFGYLDDDDLHQSVEGVSLKDTLFALLEEISQAYRRKSSSFAERVNRIVALRFGFDDGRSRTLEEVGKEFDVTRERIRQHESLLLRLLRHPSKTKRLKPFIKTKEGG